MLPARMRQSRTYRGIKIFPLLFVATKPFEDSIAKRLVTYWSLCWRSPHPVRLRCPTKP